MRTRNEGLKRKRFLPVMLALILAAAAVPMGSGLARASEGGVTADEKGSYYLRVQVANEEYTSDLADLKLQMYKVADMTEQDSAYSWNLAEPFKEYDKEGALEKLLDDASEPGVYSAEEKAKKNESYQNLATELAAIILNNKVTPTDEDVELGVKTAAANGMYILVPMLDNSNALDEQGNVTVSTAEYVYTFSPLIVSVPTKAAKADGSIGTAGEYGDWLDADISLSAGDTIEANIKVSRSDAMTNISIRKILQVWNDKDPSTFVFTVDAEKGGENVYSNVIEIHMDHAGASEPRIIKDLPVGATVTVKEKYSGSSYKFVSAVPALNTNGESVIEKIVPDSDGNINTFEFTNTYDHTNHGGGGIENRFIKEGDNDVIPDRSKPAWEKPEE